MTVIKTNLLTQLQAKINAVGPATPIEEIVQLRRAARNLGLDELPLNTELSTRIAGLNAASTIDALFEAAIALPAPAELAAINEIRPFFSDQDTLTDQYGGFWLRSGVVTYDTAAYPLANKLPVVNGDASVAPTPVAQSVLPGMTQKRIASNGNVVVAINSAGTSLTRWVGDFSTTGTAIPGSGTLAGATWVSITYDERLGLFIMLGRISTKIVSSPDGITWSVVALPSSPPGWTSDINALIFAGKTKVHLFILNKHWQSTDLTSWAAQPDITAPNAAGETLSSRDLRGAVETANGQLLLWGAFYHTANARSMVFLAYSNTGSGLACNISLTDLDPASDMSMKCAAARNATNFEIWVSSASAPRFAILTRSADGVYSLTVMESTGLAVADVPNTAVNYQGLVLRVSGQYLTATNMVRGKHLPYTGVNPAASSSTIRNASGGALVRMGSTFYSLGIGSAVTAFDFKQMIGLPTAAALDGQSGSTVGHYAAHFVRIK